MILDVVGELAVVVSNRVTLGRQPVVLSGEISSPLSIHDMFSN